MGFLINPYNFAASLPATPVVIDNIVTKTQSVATMNTNVTVASNPNRALVVCIGNATSAVDPTSVSGATNAFTKIELAAATVGGQGSTIYISLNPSVATHTISTTYGFTPNQYIAIFSLYNVEQTTGYYTGNITNRDGLSSWSNGSITPTNINSMLIDTVIANAAFTSPTQTNAFTISVFGSSYKTALADLSARTFGWTNGSAASAAQVITEIRASGT